MWSFTPQTESHSFYLQQNGTRGTNRVFSFPWMCTSNVFGCRCMRGHRSDSIFFFIYSSVHCELCTHIWNHFAASKRENSRLVSQPVVVQANGSTSSAQTVGSGGYRCSNPSSTKSISCCRGFEPWLDFQNAQKKIKAILYLIKLFAKLTGQNIKWIFYTIYTHDYN